MWLLELLPHIPVMLRTEFQGLFCTCCTRLPKKNILDDEKAGADDLNFCLVVSRYVCVARDDAWDMG